MPSFKSMMNGGGKVHSARKRASNVNKHIRIARATTGHEQEVHVRKAQKLIDRYR